MDFKFVMFHTLKCTSDFDLKDFSKVLYIHLIHTLSIRVFTMDADLVKFLANLFKVSTRSIYRAFEDLRIHGYIELFQVPRIYKIKNMNCQ